MAYRLKRSESVPDGIKRVVIAEIDSAMKGLRECRAKDRDEAIHEARKSVKKIRGAIRLLRPELGQTYREENGHFRDLGHHLSDIRDAEAVLEVFKTVALQHAGTVQKGAFDAIRRGIEAAKREKENSIEIEKLLRTAMSALRSARRRVAGWQLHSDGFAAIAPGLRLSYRRGRKALAEAQRNPNPLTHHAFRRRVKDHWYHTRLLESLWTEAQKVRESSLHDLETWLGDDHNLVVLCEQIEKEPEKYGGQESLSLFLSLAAQHQKELRDNSIALGQRLYEEKPREFVRRMEKLWEVWQHDPKSLKQLQKDQRNPPKKQPARAASKILVANKSPAA